MEWTLVEPPFYRLEDWGIENKIIFIFFGKRVLNAYNVSGSF